MRRLLAALILALGVLPLVAPPAPAAVAASAENRTSGSAAGLTTLIGIEKRLSAEAVWENPGLDYDIASDDAVAARGAKPILGRNPQVGSGRTNTELPGDRATAKSIFRNQTRGQDVTQASMPNGGVRRTAADGTQIRINPDGTTRLDLPGRGPLANGETVHIPPRD